MPENSPQIATPFGKYLLVKRLATGGMAELFLAQEPPSPELLVIKRILPYLSEEPEFVQMFLDEARIAAQLHHPNVVQVFELGRINESIFIAMEYVEGVDLRRILAEETKFSAAVPYAVAARICSAVAAGLDHAHNSRGVDGRPLGLIHRDVSPQNVMVGYNGGVKLVDFGIAKAEALAERSKPGVIKGKFLYLSPEQVSQERLDHRSDIFALGVMLYEITTGRAPFARATTENILYAIRSENPSPPHLIRDDYPQELSRIVMKCLVKDRNQRYQRASQVQADLESLLESGVMRQSNDVAAYVARLLGEEEERTQLHVPIPGGRKDLAALMPPPGLAARPKRRSSSAPEVPLMGDSTEEEMATEMSRPRDMLAAVNAALGEEESEEPTAVGTLPGRAPPPASPPARQPSRPPPPVPFDDDEESDEATAQERFGRGTPGGRRPAPPPPRRSPESLSGMERRRGPPVIEEEEGDLSSASHSVSTVNDRSPARAPASSRFEDSGTMSLPGSARAASSAEEDDEDDESTSTYANQLTGVGKAPVAPRPPSRLRLVLVAFAALIIVLGLGAAWIYFTTPAPEPSAKGWPRREKAASHPPSTAPTTGSPSTEVGVAPTPGPTGVTAGSATTPTPPVTGGTPNATDLPEKTSPTSPPTPPEKVKVQFKAPKGSSLKVGGEEVKPNKYLSLDPGTVQVRFRCPGYRGQKGTRDFLVPENPSEQVIFTLTCRANGRR
nr:serine/threonine protein kinase [Melittangium boletus]